VSRLPVKQGQAPADNRISGTRKPPRGLIREVRDIASHRVHEQRLRQLRQHRVAPRTVRSRLLEQMRIDCSSQLPARDDSRHKRGHRGQRNARYRTSVGDSPLRQQQSTEVAPRLGASYLLTKDTRNVLRGSYVRLHEQVMGRDAIALFGANEAAGQRDEYDANGDGIFESVVTTAARSASIADYEFAKNLHRPYVDEFILGFRKPFPGSTRGDGQVQAPALKTLGLNFNKSIGPGGSRDAVVGVAIFNVMNAGNYSRVPRSAAPARASQPCLWTRWSPRTVTIAAPPTGGRRDEQARRLDEVCPDPPSSP